METNGDKDLVFKNALQRCPYNEWFLSHTEDASRYFK